MTTRDPLTNPAPGDWLTNGRVDVRVDAVERGDVFFCRFRQGKPGEPVRVMMVDFVRLAAAYDVEVIAMGIPDRGAVGFLLAKDTQS